MRKNPSRVSYTEYRGLLHKTPKVVIWLKSTSEFSSPALAASNEKRLTLMILSRRLMLILF